MRAKNFVITALFLVILHSISCSNDDAAEPSELSGVIIPGSTLDTLLYFTSIHDGNSVPMSVRVPENAQFPLPAVVVLHGSGGGWKDEDTDGDGIEDVAFIGELSSQNEQWAELLNDNGYIAVFPESYTPRGTVERHGPWKEALEINPQVVRSRDAIQTLVTILSLIDENGTPLVRAEDVGLMGFSDGGSSVLPTVYDHPNATPASHVWEKDDVVLPDPLNSEEYPRYAAAISKYGGGAQNGFFGSVNDCSENVYQPYCPLRFELGENGYLTENNIKLIDCMELRGVPGIEFTIYEDAYHGFDTKDDINGPLSRAHTITFFNSHLKN